MHKFYSVRRFKEITIMQCFAIAFSIAVWASPAFSQSTTLSYSIPLVKGWNLIGNSINAAFDVRTVYGDTTKYVTIWKWGVANKKWSFFSPVLYSQGGTVLQDYATSKGYDVLTYINPGEGYWVNVGMDCPNIGSANCSIPQSGPGYFLGGASLSKGWNLVATADSVSPGDFNRSLSNAPNGSFPNNVDTLWAWDANTGSWYYYSPSMDAQGGSILSGYIASKGFEAFTSAVPVGPGRGIWANVLGTISGGTSSYTYVAASGTAYYTANPTGYLTIYAKNWPYTISFVPSTSIPSGAQISYVTYDFSVMSYPTPSGFAAGLCTDMSYQNCTDITRTPGFSTEYFNNRSPAGGFVMAFSVNGTGTMSPWSVGNGSVTAQYQYIAKQIINTQAPTTATTSASPSTKIATTASTVTASTSAPELSLAASTMVTDTTYRIGNDIPVSQGVSYSGAPLSFGPYTVTGLTGPISVSMRGLLATGGYQTMSKNGGPALSTAQTVSNGDTITILLNLETYVADNGGLSYATIYTPAIKAGTTIITFGSGSSGTGIVTCSNPVAIPMVGFAQCK